MTICAAKSCPVSSEAIDEGRGLCSSSDYMDDDVFSESISCRFGGAFLALGRRQWTVFAAFLTENFMMRTFTQSFWLFRA